MNLPVAPAIPDSSSLAAANAAASSSQSAFSAKAALNGQSTSDTGSTPASFDHVFSHVGDNQQTSTNSSGSHKGASKAGKGTAQTAVANDQAAAQKIPLSKDVSKTQVASTTSSLNQTFTGKEGDTLGHSGKQSEQSKPDAHSDQKKTASSQESADTPAIQVTTPAITADQIAAALAASAAAASVPAQTLDTKTSTNDGAAEGASTLTLKNAKGRSVTELLAQGTPVLNYQATPASVAASTADAKSAKSDSPEGEATTDKTAALPLAADSSGLSANASAGSSKHHRAAVNSDAQPNASLAGTTASTQSTSVSIAPSAAAALATVANAAETNAATQGQGDATSSNTDAAAANQALATSNSAESASASAKPAHGTITAANSSKTVVPTAGRTDHLTAWQKPVTGTQSGAEKFADSRGRQDSSGDDSSNRSTKNATLIADSKQVKNSSIKIGTDTAIGSAPMMSNLHASATNAAPSDVLATASSSAVSTTSDVHATASSHAAALVHQINEIGEGLWRVDRQSVEVNFNFGDKDHLSVRVEYKNGQVQATFNTSSTELRTAITQAWNSQNSSDNRSYKMADPVFTSSSNSSFSSSEDSSSQSRQFASFQDASSFAGAASRSRSSSSQTVSATSASTTSRASFRPEVAGHLNAIV